MSEKIDRIADQVRAATRNLVRVAVEDAVAAAGLTADEVDELQLKLVTLCEVSESDEDDEEPEEPTLQCVACMGAGRMSTTRFWFLVRSTVRDFMLLALLAVIVGALLLWTGSKAAHG